jgi:hypothetical protein
MESLEYKRNEMDVCVFNKMNSKGVQYTVVTDAARGRVRTRS